MGKILKRLLNDLLDKVEETKEEIEDLIFYGFFAEELEEFLNALLNFRDKVLYLLRVYERKEF